MNLISRTITVWHRFLDMLERVTDTGDAANDSARRQLGLPPAVVPEQPRLDAAHDNGHGKPKRSLARR